jgi:putative transposase
MPVGRSRAASARDVALFRYSLIRPLADPGLSPAVRGALVRELVAQQHVGPAGDPVNVSRSTVDRWIRAWRRGGFDALIPPPRHVDPRTEAAMLELAVALKRERPARTAAQVGRIIVAEKGWAPSARTLQRHFARHGLGGRGRDPQAPAPVFGRFEADTPNELWICDGLHAGTVRGPVIDGRDTVLFAILDDHSRYVAGGRWGFGENTLGLQAVLHDAVRAYGCPGGFYCDNGSAFSSGQLAWSLAVLDIKIIHSRVGRPQGRGKIERWNRTCREQFLVEVDTASGAGGSPVSTLAELNRLFDAWLHQHYHRAVHSETGQAPAARYHHADTPPPRRPDPEQVRRAFLWRERRVVSSFATVSLAGNRYQVDAALVGRKVDLLFNPYDLTCIEVEYHGRPMGQAAPHQVKRHAHPDVTVHVPAPVQATGIDYLRLLEAAHQAEAGRAINFPALAGDEHTNHPDQDRRR